MAGQSLKLQKFITDQVANTFGHVEWPSIFFTPAHPPHTYTQTPKTLKNWVGVQQGQSYHMRRRYLFILTDI